MKLSGGEIVPAALLVAADGGRSRLREQAGIGWISWPYRQSGIVATITHERDHGGRAVEHFLPSGPFAILPLKPEVASDGTTRHRSSIVWTERTDNVPGLLESDPEDLLAELERRFGLQLGRIAFETKPHAYPLSLRRRALLRGRPRGAPRRRRARDPPDRRPGTQSRPARCGRARQKPSSTASVSGRIPGSPEVLDAYERARRLDITAMGIVTDGLNRLFSNDLLPVRLIRDLGLGLVDRMPALKRFFIREAAGLTGREPPRLLKGEAL